MTDHALPRSDKDPRLLPMCTPVQNFYAIPHEKLQAMVEHADQHKVFAVALTLNGAAQAIKKLGDDLKKHMEGVVWSGPAGEAFRKWGNSMANETLRLSDYAKEVDKWMNFASTDLGSARRMPKYSPQDKATVDAWLKNHPLALGKVPMPGLEPLGGNNLVSGGPTQKEAYDAQKRLDDNHKAAAGLMKALSESYDQSATQILRVGRPNFRPMPEKVMPVRNQIDAPEHMNLPGSGAGGPSAVGMAGGDGAGYGGSGSSSGVGLSPSGSADRRSRRPDLDLSGGVDTPTRVPVPHPDRPPVTPPDSGRPQIPMPHVPVPNWPGSQRRPETSRLPEAPIPSRGGQRPNPRIPEPGTSIGRRPETRLPTIPRDGIVGGRPTPRGPSVPTQPPGRAAVFGTEPPPRQGQTRPPVPGTSFGGVPGPTASGSGTGGVGRYRVTEPGGVVGGGPSRGPVGGGSTHFTPGGTGLVRGGTAGEGGSASSTRQGMTGGLMPGAGVGGASSDRRTGSRRPDYLVEDEETWQQSGRNVVPPVIE
ncbi:hypothetical protein GO001_08015 [Streptomyces sp. NRRL B-1677]|uniref:hypothetical protein n=1 Tax=Streptomyces sp. NRRL B-1677 TaxID=2682966 RepID=UPI0018929443|nr:hypothetical protein [Streptomyces sp. NRRL B-1677]MBF6045168.1 hypothetical protein [Streptomyces sp. NRRL B-1677]